jgi:chromosome partitioning protein
VKDLRADETPVVQPAQVNRLGVILQEAEKQGAAFAVIDTSPILTAHRSRLLALPTLS